VTGSQTSAALEVLREARHDAAHSAAEARHDARAHEEGPNGSATRYAEELEVKVAQLDAALALLDPPEPESAGAAVVRVATPEELLERAWRLIAHAGNWETMPGDWKYAARDFSRDYSAFLRTRQTPKGHLIVCAECTAGRYCAEGVALAVPEWVARAYAAPRPLGGLVAEMAQRAREMPSNLGAEKRHSLECGVFSGRRCDCY
jgi:hypothetical protein